MKLMNPEVKNLWIEALRSGEYRQGVGALRNKHDEFCCLGVLCNLHAQAHPEVAAQENNPGMYMNCYGKLPHAVATWSGVDEWGTIHKLDDDDIELVALNDDGASFDDIADIIEEHL